MKVRFYIQFIFLLLSTFCSWAQIDDSLPSDQYMDSFVRTPRTTKIGKLIKKWTYRVPHKKSNNITVVPQEKQPNYEKYNGKVIRSITINSYAPFGENFKRPERKANQYEKIGNALHGKTKKITIKNILLIKKNDLFDANKMKESERLLRSLGYIRTAEISIDSLSSKDSIDLIVNTLDSWSIYASGSITPAAMSSDVYTRNFIGLGHYLSLNYRTIFNQDRHGYGFRYIIPNIAQKFITFQTHYNKDVSGNYLKYIQINRDFYSPLANWGGGLSLLQNFYRDSVPNLNNSLFINQDFKYNEWNGWVGVGIPLRNKEDIQKRVNLYMAIRYNQQDFIDKPSYEYDPLNYFEDKKLLLFSVGVNSYAYKKERYVFYDNRVEDIPTGKRIRFTYGKRWKNQEQMPYYSVAYTYANQFSFGYISSTMQWGSFAHNRKLQEGVFQFETLYFSPLHQIGAWKFRNFIYHDFVYGINRLDYEKDRITINGRDGIDGFSSYHLRGTKKTTLTLQTQTYSPYSLLGFRFNPFANISLALINSEKSNLLQNELYAKIGVGVQITNDYLTFSRFTLSIAFFPHIPNRGYNIFQYNNLRNNHFNFHHFQISEPHLVPYR